MRRTRSYLLLVALVLLSGCVREASIVDPGKNPVLSVKPFLYRDAVATKVEDTDLNILAGDSVDARDELRENFFGTLDIFVKTQAAAASSAWFKEYHLKAGDPGVVIDPSKYDSKSLLDQAKQALASNWAEQGYEPDVPYDIYVTANNPHTASGSAPSNLTALKALTTNTTDVYRYYLTYTPPDTDPVYWSNCMYSEEKEFLMDGKIEGWQIDPSTSEQVFDVDLQRAAAKVIVTVNFSDEKTIPMIPEDPNEPPQTDAQGRIVMGSVQEYMQFVGRTAGVPRWKPVNFNFNASDIYSTENTLPADGPLLTLDSNFTPFQEGNDADNTNNTFAFVTYTYPIDWSSDASRTPYVLLSVFYTRNSDGDQLRSYYRIPICDEHSVTSIDRNHVYLVDVEIASLGASNESFEAQDEELRIEYHVIPWTETNMTQEATTVKISDTKYLTILPTEYTLKGDDTQSVEMLWYASVSTADNRIVDINPNSLSVSYVNYLGNTVDIKGSVTKQVRNDSGTLVTATDGNTDGKRDIVITSTAPTGTGAVAHGETVTITLTPNGLLRVESEALESRAIKDIQFTVYLKNASGVDPVTITIRHFPLDNIQSFTGEWSSRWGGGYSTDTVMEYSFNPAADGWSTWDGYEDHVDCSSSDYNKASSGKSTEVTNDPIGSPSDYESRSDIESGTNNSSLQTAFRNAVPQGTSRQNANSEANAYYDADSGYWYWGQTQTTSNTSQNSYDWYTSGWNNRTYYRWTTYYRRKYFKSVTHYYARRYYRNVETNTPTTGSWVEWGVKNGTTNEGIYTAKVYYNGQCYPINTYNTRGSGNNYTNLTNNHMYVLQITSTSDKYVLGRPVLDANYQSQDKVVSPAFMIASQLGAVNTTNSGTTASTHCGTYMEVEAGTGKRFVGWRLPTKQEIEVIIGYQNGTYTNKVTMEVVLGGAYYWALDGTTANVPSGSGGSTTTGYVRCVRDLTLEEVNTLNRTTD